MKDQPFGVLENIRPEIVRAPPGKFLHSAKKYYRAGSEPPLD
jgi:hypothetical protein